jgi:hypothetical protein
MPLSTLVKSQFKTLTAENVRFEGVLYRKVEAEIRFDDQCGNGHNTFGITGSAWRKGNFNGRNPDACGCCHDLIRVAFPELAAFIQWHGVTSEGPLHYAQNTIYLAGDRDYNGHRAGEPSRFEDRIKIGSFPVLFSFKNSKFLSYLLSGIDFSAVEVVAVQHVKTEPGGYDYAPKYTFSGMDLKWYECAFDTEIDALNMLQALRQDPPALVRVPVTFSSGKLPELEAARACAIWPDATLDQLTDADQLAARLPALMAEFKKAVLSLGFEF